VNRASYRTIQTEVLRRIRSREWPPGQIIPSEVDLAAEFDCARATINRALRELAQTGLLDRRRKAGTRVSLNPVRKATLDIPVTRTEVQSRGLTYRHKVLERNIISAPRHLITRMNLTARQPVMHLKTLHLADDRPFLYEDRWVNIAAAPGITTAPLDTISANEWLVQNVPISAGDIAFMAQPANQADARALDISPGDALFVIERLTFVGAATVTQVRLAYAPGYRMTTQI